MPLTYVALLSLATFALLNFLAIPRIERQIRVDRSAAVIGKAGTLSLLGFLRTVSLILGSTAVLILLAMAILDWSHASAIGSMTAAIERAQGWRDALYRFRPVWSFIVLALLVIAMWILAKKTGKRRVEKIFQEALDEDLNRLQKERDAGNWPDLPPTSSMEQLLARFEQLRTLLEQVEASKPGNQEEEVQRERAKEAIGGELQKIQGLYFQMDVARRVQVDLDPDRVAYPPPRTWKERVQYFFMSQGLMAGLRGGTRGLFIAGFVLLEIAFLGVQSPQIGKALDARIVKLDELRVAASEKEALEQWTAAQGGTASAAAEAWTAEDEAAANAASAHFEDALAASEQWNPIVRRAGVSLRPLYVRQQILSRAVAGDATERLAKYASLSEVSDLDPLSRETVHSYEEAFGGRRPRTEAGRRIYSTIREVAQKHPVTWERIRSSVKAGAASFQVPTTADDLTRMMLTRLTGGAAEGLGGSGGELGHLLQNIDQAVGPDALRRAYTIKSSQYLSALAGGSPLDEAVRLIVVDKGVRPVWTQAEATGLKAVVEASVPDGAKIEQHPPALFTQPEPHVSSTGAVRAADDLRNQLAIPRNSESGAELTNALANFGDHFPGQVGSERTTLRGELLEKWSSGGDDLASGLPLPDIGPRPGGPPGSGLGISPPPRPRPPSPSSFGRGSPLASRSLSSFARARSFIRLRGFSRIGGVLIGNNPAGDPSKRLDFRDLRWRQDGEKLRLLLLDAKGAEVDLGAFRPTLIRQALTYAADARPITVTMVGAEPLTELKILLHPALVDTPLGCRAIELDRFVDRLTGDHRARVAATETLVAQTSLYELAWAHRVKAIVESSMAKEALQGDSDAAKAFAAISGEAESRLRNPGVLEGALGALSDPAALRDPKRSPLPAKTVFFDPALVGYIKACALAPGAVASSEERLGGFARCIENRTAGDLDAYLSNSKGKWYEPPPEFQVWSGVRERSFTLDPALSFLKSPAGKGVEAQLWPFDFMLQMAFTSAPAYTGQQVDPESYVDETPWEFPSIAGVIPSEVAKGVRADPELQSIFVDMKEFTTLQRFFRVGLAGGLGQRFQMERLVGLMDATVAQRPRAARTLRWNPRPGLLEATLARRLSAISGRLDEMLGERAIDATDREWVQRASRSMRSCRDLIAGSGQPAAIPQDQWVTRCSLDSLGEKARAAMGSDPSEAGSLVLSASRFTTLTTQARKMRRDLGVQVDDRQAQTQRSCPAL